jgi:isopenicillin-N N-acyltransferase-like protein
VSASRSAPALPRAWTGPSRLSFVIAETAGDPRALGRAQGEASAAQIVDSWAFYERMAAGKSIDLDVAGRDAVRILDNARSSVPAAVAEIEGLAEGSGVSFQTIALLNCMEEVWPWAPESCTTMVAGRFLMHAEQWFAGHSEITVIIAHPDDAPAFVSPTCAGFLPAVGMSSSGFAQGIDSLSAADDGFGIPRVAISRLALGARDVEAAIGAACTQGRAGGYAHVLATTDRQLVLETSASTAMVLNRVTAHTNHYLGTTASIGSESAGSVSRLHRAEELLRRNAPQSLEECTELLADHHGRPQSICLHEDGIDGDGTVFGMACDLKSGHMMVSDGSPCAGKWHEFVVPVYEGYVDVV